MTKQGRSRAARGATIAMPVALPLFALGGCAPFEAPPAPTTEACCGAGDGSCLPPDRWPGVCVIGNNNRPTQNLGERTIECAGRSLPL